MRGSLDTLQGSRGTGWGAASLHGPCCPASRLPLPQKELIKFRSPQLSAASDCISVTQEAPSPNTRELVPTVQRGEVFVIKRDARPRLMKYLS